MRKMKLVMLSLAFTTLASFTAFAADQGWVKEDNAWYFQILRPSYPTPFFIIFFLHYSISQIMIFVK